MIIHAFELKKLLCLFICIVVCLSVITPFAAKAEEKERVSVAYIDYNNFIQPNGEGGYSGYGADYLKRIAEYTGWQYDFVNLSWTEAYDAVKSGMVDFYCVARQTEERQKDFDFSIYPVCNEEMNIYTMPVSDIYYQDYVNMNGKKVGMLKASGEIDYFKEYSASNGFTCEVVEYPMNEDAVNALERGEVDLIALVNYSVSGKYKLIGNFGVAPAYMMSCQGSAHLAEFSRAQEKLYFDDSAFTSKLESRYYSELQLASNLMLSREEVEYIAELKQAGTVLNVAVSVDMAPIEYFDKKTNSYKGLTVDLYNRISERTGLSFNFVQRENRQGLLAGMESGAVTLVGALAKNQKVAQNLSLTQSIDFSENTLSLVTKDILSLNSVSCVAIPAGYPQFLETAIKNGYKNYVEYPTFEACVQAVDKGKADLTFIVSMCEEYLLGHATYADLSATVCEASDYGICFGAYDKEDLRLISILNKTIATIPNREINELIITNTAIASPEQTFMDFIISNGLFLLIGAIVILSLVTVIIIWVQKNRNQSILNKKLQLNHQYLEHLNDTLPCGILRYEYATPHRIISYNSACAGIYGYEDDFPVVGKTPDVVVEAGTEEAFRKKFDECIEAKGIIIYDWAITRRDGSRAYTESVMDIVETEDGKVFQEVLIDITERKEREIEIQQKYNNEINRSGKQDSNLLYNICFDVTEQKLVKSDLDISGIFEGMSLYEFNDAVWGEVKGLQTPETLADLRSKFSVEYMKSEYERGNFEYSFELCRERDGQAQWLRSNLVLRSNPVNGHLMCFDYIHDVTDELITKTVVRTMAFADCEYIGAVFISTGKCIEYMIEPNSEVKRTDAQYGNNDILCRLCEEMTTEDADSFRLATSVATVKERLQEECHYQVYATLHGNTERRVDKTVSFFYLNKQGGVLVYTVVDVTEVRAGEVLRAKLLADALSAAKKADAAKSRFLSGVSHELRTPLNAIIGFMELAKDSDADAEKIANCLASSDIAAKQLLSVINDVLDMSSIESGKMKVASAPFNFRSLLTSITNIYGTQCKQKGVTFESRITTPLGDWLVGDELRVNQILMNLLGNAVKFTSEGSIELTVSQTELENNKVFVRFLVSDTGCGMTEEMRLRLFKPFEQQNAETARKYGGSGLGLSIVKNLVELMNGNVTVESEYGKGTTFIVDIPFQKSKFAENYVLPKQVDELHVLTVDDEPSEREYMSLVLKRMGVRFNAVCGGDEALEELEKSSKANDIYNVCLVDWRMPGLDGFETTRRIREKYGKDLIVIVVSAYDFQQTQEYATKAGANLFMTKPIFQSTLFDLFMTLTNGRITKANNLPRSWDFVGKRVLLVEDNLLNQIVAKGYLSKCNVVVDVADDGKKAVDMFEASETGYYDAILMDIQMPIMDGYTATRAIRASSHYDAKTIPIIAQSADAFNEDISKALSAGMNAHVAKPIKPDVLAKALYKAFLQGKAEKRLNPERLSEYGIDYKVELARFKGDVALYEMVLNTFADTEILNRARQAFESRNTEVLLGVINEAKAVSGNSGFVALYTFATRLSSLLCSSSYTDSELVKHFNRFECEYTRVYTGIRNALE